MNSASRSFSIPCYTGVASPALTVQLPDPRQLPPMRRSMIRLPFQVFRAPRLALAAALGLALPAMAGAQEAGAQQPPAHISYIEGRVVIESDAGTSAAEDATPVVP